MSEKRKSIESVTDWLGVTDAPNWRVARILGLSLSVTVGLLFLLALVAAFGVLLRMVFAGGEVTLGAGALVAALLGAPFVIWGTVLKHQTVMFQKEGHMTDRINKAVEQLGAEKTIDRIGRPVTISATKPEAFSLQAQLEATTQIEWQGIPISFPAETYVQKVGDWEVFSETIPNIEVRIGAILSLERIGQDSMRHDNGRDHVRIMEIFCAYVRENSQVKTLSPAVSPFRNNRPRIDIQTILNVIKRRSSAQISVEVKERYRIDLRETDLEGGDFSGGNFSGGLFWHSRLEAANFSKTDLIGTQFQGCLLNYSIFFEANLNGTVLNKAVLSEANILSFVRTKIHGVLMEDADMTGWRFRNKAASKETFGSRGTKVANRYLQKVKEGLNAADRLSLMDHRGESDLYEASALKEIQFSNWNPFTLDDGAAVSIRRAYRASKGHIGWPFED